MKKSVPKFPSICLALSAMCAGLPFFLTPCSAQVLTNRWSFNEPAGNTTVTDSVSGVIGTLQGSAQIDGAGNLVLNGASSPGALSLPGGLINNLTSVTIEAWVTNSSTPDNVCLFEFSDGSGTGTFNGGSWNGVYIRMVLHDGGNTENFLDFQNVGNPNSGKLAGKPGLGGYSMTHIVCVYDPVAGMEAVYTNGILEASVSGATLGALANVPAGEASIGQSPWWAWGDPYLQGTISEFRIWSGAFTYSNVVASYVAGPDTLPGVIPLTIIAQPTPPAAPLSPGQSVTLSVNAFSSSQPITYHWANGPVGGPYVDLSNGTMADGTVVSGATSNVLTISNLTLADGANYVVKLSDSTGTNVTSSVSTVIVVSAPTVLLDTTPSSFTNFTTKTAQFQALFSGSQPISYQWQVSTNGGTNYSNVNDANVTGSTSTNLVFNNLQFSEAGLYRLHVSNANGTTNSTPAQLVVVSISQEVFDWQTPVVFGSFAAPAADQILNGPAGAFFEAEGGSGGSPTVVTTTDGHTYTFQSDGSAATWSGGSGPANYGFLGSYTTGNADLDSVLGNAYFDGGTHTIVLHNLTPGVGYSVQLFGMDDRNPESARRSNYQDPANALDQSATFAMGDNVYIIGTFTATSSDVAIRQNLLDGGGSGNLSGVVVRALAPPVSLQAAGSSLQLNWAYGTLLQATNIAGPWTTNTATPPYTLTPTSPQMFFRVQVP